MTANTTPAGPAQSTAALRPTNLRRITYIAAAASIGGFLFGYDSAVINGALTGIQHRFDVTSSETGTIVASALLGSAFGAAVAGRLADRIGRPRVMHLAALLFAISALCSSVPFSAVPCAASLPAA
ncbi:MULTISPECIES: MFS transporter [Streptomyces]|uniref:MFS transporter n=2 Tax=Streptomyces TaxID=1883 RepID=A0ABV9J2Y8_9ACTN